MNNFSRTAVSLVCLCIILVLGCSSSEKKEPEDDHRDETAEKEVHLSKDVLENFDLEFGQIEKTPLYEIIETTGKVIQDTDKMTYVFSPSAGTVKKILVNVGESVKKGRPLIQVGNRTLRASREGTVLSVNTSVGSRVGSLESLVALGVIDPIRVVFDVYPADMDSIAMGQKVEVKLIGHPEHVFPGTIRYISPRLDEASQTLKVGADVENIDSHLKFGMFVQGDILSKTAEETSVLPNTALVRFDDGFYVFVPGDEEGSFIRLPVKIGTKGTTGIEMLEGPKVGTKVVTKGSFTLKSEFLRGSMGEGHAH